MADRKTAFTRQVLSEWKNTHPESSSQIEYSDAKISGLTLVTYRSKKQVFYLSLSYQKIRYREKIGEYGVISISDARQQANALKMAIQLGETDLGIKRKSKMLFSELADKYLVYSELTKESYKDDVSRLKHHLLPTFGRKQLCEITTLMINRLHAEVKESRSAGTANRCLTLTKAIFTYAIKHEKVLKDSPAKGIKPYPEPMTERLHMTYDEIEKWLAALETEPNIEVKNILKFLLLTGCRKGNAMSIKFEDFNADTGRVLLKMTKSGKGQYLTLSDKAIEIIQQQQEKYGKTGNGLVFRSSCGQKQIPDPLRTMKVICVRAGIREFSVHALRHTYSVMQLESGMYLYQLKTELNHQHISTTERYANINDNKRRKHANTLANLLIN